VPSTAGSCKDARGNASKLLENLASVVFLRKKNVDQTNGIEGNS